MDQLKPSYYFALEGFAHASIFDGLEQVWQALPLIKEYLSQAKLGEVEGTIDERAYLINPEQISIGQGTVVEPGAYIHGPCIIGKNCTIRHGAYIRGNLIAGDNCVIGHDTEVKNAIFLNKAQAAHFAYVGDSILGAHCNLGAGTKLANLKLDGGQVAIRLEGRKIDSGLRKFGAILGDGVQLGCNSVTNPGTLVGPQAGCYPCVNIGGFVPGETIVRNSRGAPR